MTQLPEQRFSGWRDLRTALYGLIGAAILIASVVYLASLPVSLAYKTQERICGNQSE